jgi:hypothetical protein
LLKSKKRMVSSIWGGGASLHLQRAAIRVRQAQRAGMEVQTAGQALQMRLRPAILAVAEDRRAQRLGGVDAQLVRAAGQRRISSMAARRLAASSVR